MSKMKEKGEISDNEEESENAEPIRHSGMMVAAAVDDHEQEARAVNLLRVLGAAEIERATGTIANGDWQDFNPVEPPSLISPPSEQTASSVTTERRV